MQIFRKGSIGIVIDVFAFSWFELGIERKTGDGFHTYCLHGGTKITEALVKEGVVEGSLDKYYDGKSVSLILEPKEEYFSEHELDTVIDSWRADVGKKYDFKNIFMSQLFKRDEYVNDRKRICSEHTAKGYESIGYKFMEKPYSSVSPHDFIRDVIYRDTKKFRRHLISR